jgi:fumarylacetoacetase
MANAENNIFGMVLMNDWSARDIQKWEYVPLGPFGSKNFGTWISPWVVSLDALKPFQCETSAGVQTPIPLPYLVDPTYSSFDIDLSVAIQPEGCDEAYAVGRSNFRHLYWTIKQQLVHHTVTGCNVKAGDLMGSGTISETSENAFGSMLELSWRGSKEVVLKEEGEQK